MARGVVPARVQHLEGSSDVIVPALRKIAVGEVYIIHEVHFVLVGKESSSDVVGKGIQVTYLYFLFGGYFQAFVFVRIVQYLDSLFVIDDKCREARADVDFTVSVHVIIHSRCPFDAQAGGETVVFELHALCHFFRAVYGMAPVHGYTGPYCQSVYDFNIVGNVQVHVLEVIQL